MKRSDVINKIIQYFNLNNPNYLEIGVWNGDTLKDVNSNNKDGVDPEHYDKCSLVNYKMTSDNFFNNHIIKKYDIIFIDGLHTAYQVSVDLYNSIKNLNENGFIVLDDVYPHNEEEQKSLDLKNFGKPLTGDVWKAVYHLLDTFQDICHNIYFFKDTERGNLVLHIKDNTKNIVIDESMPTSNVNGWHPCEWNKYSYKEDFNNYFQKLSLYKALD